jgi:hypothetical protein
VSGFKVGDRVRIARLIEPGLDGTGSNRVGTEFTIDELRNSDSRVAYGETDSGERVHGVYTYRLDKVDVSLSKGTRVKLTLGESVLLGEIVEDRYLGNYLRVQVDGDENGARNFDKAHWAVEVLLQPIVLPTRKNALIEIKRPTHMAISTFRYVPHAYNKEPYWVSGNGSMHPSSELLELVEKYRDTYRVIFSGE